MTVSVPLPLESGLSECARYPSALGCDGLDLGLALLTLGVLAVVVWLLAAGSATTMIARRHPARSAVWLAVVWCLPILGALSWYTYLAGIHASRRTSAN
ncbi:hypothetical protein H7K45_08720 [Mycobacterium yunnanensis]|uniref:Phospholipase_D-nuclease N-terminal n=1 Tax=Mycobacterium yunnanensis TaxID=368477 RepID=A0A9X3BT01_9MYCO|nr:PLDc N-terminal domain-containing protein [Mycobacterium yunnanensis]MCV7420620.1 hypothetical protein [Mycobacterium yunnanensis]